MKFCTNCGNSYESTSDKCPVCGHFNKVADNTSLNGGNLKADTQKSENSVFLKYADFLDDNILYQTALCKLNGLGVDEDKGEAFEMFRTLAYRGNYDAMYKLAEMYLNGTPSDELSAVNWLAIAADGGHTQSKIKLKMMGSESVSIAAEKITIPKTSIEFEQLVEDALPSIVKIDASIKSDRKRKVLSGSGFIVGGGYVITNAHVLGNNPDCVSANFEPGIDGKSYNLLPIHTDKNMDIAVLKFTGLKEEKIAAQKNLSFRLNDVSYGEEVYTVGNPLGLGLSVSRGVISCPSRKSDYPRGVSEVIQTDITANHGNSGGALLDKNNNVLGMVTYHPGNSEGGIAMCIPSKYIIEILNCIK